MLAAQKETPLKDGMLGLIQIDVHNDHGDKFRTELFLTRKQQLGAISN